MRLQKRPANLCSSRVMTSSTPISFRREASREHPVTTRQLQRVFRTTADAAGFDDNVTVHTLRHCFATHLLEQGVDIRVIQDLLGHRHIDSTSKYARVAINTIRQIKSPLDALNIGKPPPA